MGDEHERVALHFGRDAPESASRPWSKLACGMIAGAVA